MKKTQLELSKNVLKKFSLEFYINTNPLIFYDSSHTYYLSNVLMTHRFGLSMSPMFASLGMKLAQTGVARNVR